MKAIIFGANGQDGFYLRKLLLEQEIEVIGVSRGGDFLKLPLHNFSSVETFIKEQQPDFIFHLAANSTAAHYALFENHETIATGTLNILEAVKNHSPHSKVFISGSALQFVNNNKPIKETDAFEARDAYSISRIQSVYAARYFRSLGLKVYVGYFFNHDSPLRSERHVSKKISEAAKRIGAGSQEHLVIGDISVKKEWTFAGDVVKAVWLFVNQENIYEAMLGSGISYSIEEWLEACFLLVNKDWSVYTTTEAGFKAGYKELVSDNSLITSLGWKPEVSFSMLAKMMVK